MGKRRIEVRKTVKKKRGVLSDMVRRSELRVITAGKELRDQKLCFHINERHPNVISQFNVSAIHDDMKMGIVKWITEGKIYILK